MQVAGAVTVEVRVEVMDEVVVGSGAEVVVEVLVDVDVMVVLVPGVTAHDSEVW